MVEYLHREATDWEVEEEGEFLLTSSVGMMTQRFMFMVSSAYFQIFVRFDFN